MGEAADDNWKGSGDECKWLIIRGDDLISRLGVSGGCCCSDKRLVALWTCSNGFLIDALDGGGVWMLVAETALALLLL